MTGVQVYDGSGVDPTNDMELLLATRGWWIDEDDVVIVQGTIVGNAMAEQNPQYYPWIITTVDLSMRFIHGQMSLGLSFGFLERGRLRYVLRKAMLDFLKIPDGEVRRSHPVGTPWQLRARGTLETR
jgi:hypothetical protein